MTTPSFKRAGFRPRVATPSLRGRIVAALVAMLVLICAAHPGVPVSGDPASVTSGSVQTGPSQDGHATLAALMDADEASTTVRAMAVPGETGTVALPDRRPASMPVIDTRAALPLERPPRTV